MHGFGRVDERRSVLLSGDPDTRFEDGVDQVGEQVAPTANEGDDDEERHHRVGIEVGARP